MAHVINLFLIFSMLTAILFVPDSTARWILFAASGILIGVGVRFVRKSNGL
jgi:hypothetical protein